MEPVSLEHIQSKLYFSIIGSSATTILRSRTETGVESSRKKKHRAAFSFGEVIAATQFGIYEEETLIAVILMLAMFAIFLIIEYVKNGRKARELKVVPSQFKPSSTVRLRK